jgi:hypothetical protein
VVRQRDRRHLELLRPLDQVAQPVGAVEEGEFAVGVEVDEGQFEVRLILFGALATGHAGRLRPRLPSRDR